MFCCGNLDCCVGGFLCFFFLPQLPLVYDTELGGGRKEETRQEEGIVNYVLRERDSQSLGEKKKRSYSPPIHGGGSSCYCMVYTTTISQLQLFLLSLFLLSLFRLFAHDQQKIPKKKRWGGLQGARRVRPRGKKRRSTSFPSFASAMP